MTHQVRAMMISALTTWLEELRREAVGGCAKEIQSHERAVTANYRSTGKPFQPGRESDTAKRLWVAFNRGGFVDSLFAYDDGGVSSGDPKRLSSTSASKRDPEVDALIVYHFGVRGAEEVTAVFRTSLLEQVLRREESLLKIQRQKAGGLGRTNMFEHWIS